MRRFLPSHVSRQFQNEFDSATTWESLKPLVGHLFSAEEILLLPQFREDLEFEVLKWQSHLWNALALRTRTTVERLPMWGVESASLYEDIWQPRDGCVDDEILELTHQFQRPLLVTARHHVITECAEGYRHEFTLPPGAFATVFLNTLYTVVDCSQEEYPKR